MAATMTDAVARGGLRRCDDRVFAVTVVAGLVFAYAAEDRLYRDGRGIFRALRLAKLIFHETEALDGFGRPVEGSEFHPTDSRYVGLRPLMDAAAVMAAVSLAGEGGAPLPPRGPRGASAMRAARWWSPWPRPKRVGPLARRLAPRPPSFRSRPRAPAPDRPLGTARLSQSSSPPPASPTRASAPTSPPAPPSRPPWLQGSRRCGLA